MKILLHTCCAPCLLYPLKRLKEQGNEVRGYFYNPNIHPYEEYKKRLQAVDQLKKDIDTEIIYPEYKPEDFFQEINFKESAPLRCSLCWALRLKKTACAAKEAGFDSFTTTLLVSPYQDQTLLKNIGQSIAKEQALSFYYEDFRSGFREAHNQAKSLGIYCQKYCGCIYSEIERCMKSAKR